MNHIEELLELAAKSPCREKRGVVAVRDGEVIGRGFNAPVGGACSDDVCRVVNIRTIPGRNEFEADEEIRTVRSCGVHVEHAEAMAIRFAVPIALYGHAFELFERQLSVFDAYEMIRNMVREAVKPLAGCELIHLNTELHKCERTGDAQRLVRSAKPSRRRGCPSCAVLASSFGIDAIWLLHDEGWQRWTMAEYAKLAGVA